MEKHYAAHGTHIETTDNRQQTTDYGQQTDNRQLESETREKTKLDLAFPRRWV